MVSIRQLHEYGCLAARNLRAVDHVAAARLREANPHAVHLAELDRLHRFAPRWDVEERRLRVLLLVVRILVERPFVPCVQEVAPLRAVLELTARIDRGSTCGRPVRLRLLAPLGEQRFGVRRTSPRLAPYVLAARPSPIIRCQRNSGKRQSSEQGHKPQRTSGKRLSFIDFWIHCVSPFLLNIKTSINLHASYAVAPSAIAAG